MYNNDTFNNNYQPMKTHRLQQTILGFALSLLAGIILFALFAPNASAANDCPLTFSEPADVFEYAHNGTIEFSEFQKQNGQAVITVTNNSDCQLPLALGSYQMMSGNNLSEQQLHDEQIKTVPAQSSRTLKVDLPSCMAQIDLYHDPGQDGVPTPPQPANPSLIGFTFSGNEKDVFAENDMFHFDDGHPYEDLDNFPNDDDDGYRNAEPAEDSRYCDVEPETCPYPNDRLPIEEPADLFEFVDEGTLEFSQFQKDNEQAAISITNNSECEFPVALGVYKMFDNKLENQELHDQDTAVVSANSQETVAADLPACMAQIDLLYDPNEDGPPATPSLANPNVIGFTFYQNEEDIFAENDMFHFDDGHQYEDLDEFPNDEDDSPRDAGPSENFCPADSPTTQLTIIKKVSNKDGRDINPSDFDITATPHSGNSPSFIFNGSSDGETHEVSAIRYNLSESGPDNVDFTTSYSGDCQARTDGAGGQVTPQSGETAVCTITNTLKDTPDPEPITCPFTEGSDNNEYDEVITFSDNSLRSDQAHSDAVTEKKELSASGGTYRVGMFAYTQSSERTDQTQESEQYFLRFDNDNTGYSEETVSTDDLADGVRTATTTKITSLTLDESTSNIQARHSVFFGKADDDGTANSHKVGCVAIDKTDTQDPLTGNCSVAPNNPETGETVTWSSSANGGTGNYSFDWSGAANGNDSTVSREYNQTGKKTATVTISDGEDTIERSCSVNVRDDDDDDGNGGGGGGGDILDPRDDDDDGEVRGTQDEDFSVQCQPEKDSYLVGEQATFTADIDGDIDEDDVSFSWENGRNLTTDDNEAMVQYVSAGTKTIKVTAEYEDEEETDTCEVSIRRADNRSGVRLDQVPYTGPSDTARTVGFGLLLLALAVAGSYFGLRKFRKEEVPVGIPQDGKRR